MADDPSRSGGERSWLERISAMFNNDEPESLDDILEILRSAGEDGIINREVARIAEGALKVSEMAVREVMIPRSQMVVINEDDDPADFLPLVFENAHSRYPVVGDSHDEVIGVLLAKDLLNLVGKGKDERFVMKDYVRPATFIPESKRLHTLLSEFRSTRNHMAIVLDEYGGVAGLVTIEDVLEQIVGDIADEHDYEEENNIRKTGPNQWMVEAVTGIDEFNEAFGTRFSDEDFDTIGGILLQKFGHIPERGEEVIEKNLAFRVLKADNRRIELLQVDRI